MLITTAALIVLAHAPTQEAIDPAQQAPILARVLAYDRNLEGRSGAEVVLAVVHKPDDPASVEDGRRMLAAFKKLEAHPLKGKPFRVVSLPWHSNTSIADASTRLGIDAIYVAAGLQYELAAITAQSRAAKVISMSGSATYCSLGVSLGLDVEAGKPKLVVNTAAIRDEGALFSSDLLRLARVVR